MQGRSQTVLVAGSAAALRESVASSLLSRADARVRLLVGARDHDLSGPDLASLAARGADVVTGEVSNPASAAAAFASVDAIVAVFDAPSRRVAEAARALGEAGESAGARRLVLAVATGRATIARPGRPADRPTEAALDRMRRIDIEAGAPMEAFLPDGGVIVSERGAVRFAGDERPIAMTSLDDVARMVARVALDRSLGDGVFAFAGDRLSTLEAADIVATALGQPLARRTERDAGAMKADGGWARAAAALRGPQQDGRYLDLRLESFAEFVARTLSARSARRGR